MTVHSVSAPVEPVVLAGADRFLNYRGDRRSAVGQPMGPTYSGREVLTVLTAEYDDVTDRTRLGLAYGRYQIPEPTA